MRIALVGLTSLTFSLACVQAVPAPFPRSHAKEPPLTLECVKAILTDEHRFWSIDSIEERGRGFWVVVGCQGIPWTDTAWTVTRTALVYENKSGQGPRLTIQSLEGSLDDAPLLGRPARRW